MPHRHNDLITRRRLGRRRLALCVLITVITMVIEFIAGLLTGSLALISDAGHMLSHGFALIISYLAMLLALKPATARRTFGLYRAEILAALFNGGSLLVISGFIFWHAYRRLLQPVEIAAGWMLLVAVIGLCVNMLTAFILRRSAGEDLNIKSAFFHMLGDMVSSVVVVFGAVAILWTGWYPIDPILSVLVCVIILIWAYGLIRESVEILLEATPAHVDIPEIEERLAKLEGVRRVHDTHVWSLTSGFHSMSAHVEVDDISISQSCEILARLGRILKEEFKISHYTIQFECGECRGDRVQH